MKYDKEERDILDALEKGKMKLATPSKKEIESIKAMEMGMPYQTLISGIIHRYVEGDIKIKTG
jgi:predicted DNA binding CopG/RHH family protein